MCMLLGGCCDRDVRHRQVQEFSPDACVFQDENVTVQAVVLVENDAPFSACVQPVQRAAPAVIGSRQNAHARNTMHQQQQQHPPVKRKQPAGSGAAPDSTAGGQPSNTLPDMSQQHAPAPSPASSAQQSTTQASSIRMDTGTASSASPAVISHAKRPCVNAVDDHGAASAGVPEGGGHTVTPMHVDQHMTVSSHDSDPAHANHAYSTRSQTSQQQHPHHVTGTRSTAPHRHTPLHSFITRPTEHPSCVLSFICKTPDTAGKFDAKRAQALQLKAGWWCRICRHNVYLVPIYVVYIAGFVHELNAGHAYMLH